MTVRNFLDSCLHGGAPPPKASAIGSLQQCTQSGFDAFFLEVSLLWLLHQSRCVAPKAPEPDTLDARMRLQFGTAEDDN